jgi:ankyrin repeat protein
LSANWHSIFKQLVSCVKTNNYEQTLRILSQGADANYRCQETGNQCVHQAVLNNQLGQIEILCLYGADLSGVDRNGHTPLDLARQLSNATIADRLVELQFELTDDISYFLCNKRPEHKNGKHFLIPEASSSEPKETRNLKLDDVGFRKSIKRKKPRKNIFRFSCQTICSTSSPKTFMMKWTVVNLKQVNT